jgi:hypothetical protein
VDIEQGYQTENKVSHGYSSDEVIGACLSELSASETNPAKLARQIQHVKEHGDDRFKSWLFHLTVNYSTRA